MKYGYDFKEECALFNQKQKEWLGKTVSKKFKGSWHNGMVVQVIPPDYDDTDRDIFFKICYEDGDGEDVTFETMLQMWSQRKL